LHTKGGLGNKTGCGSFGKMPVRINRYGVFQLGKCHDRISLLKYKVIQ
jgi:hypothetical protein